MSECACVCEGMCVWSNATQIPWDFFCLLPTPATHMKRSGLNQIVAISNRLKQDMSG